MLQRISPLLFLFFLFVISCDNSDDNSDSTPQGPDVVVVDDTTNDTFITDESVQLNPSGRAPLSAEIALTLSESATIEMRIVGQNGQPSDINKVFSNDETSVSIPIHGLYADYENTVILSFTRQDGTSLGSKTYSIQTESLIPEMPQISIDVANINEMAPGLTFVSYFGHVGVVLPQRPFMFDAYGDIRWYLNFSSDPVLGNLFYDNGMERLQNGNFFFGNGNNATIYEIDLFGTILNSWDMPGYSFHHEVIEKPNGNFIATVNKLGAGTVEDYLIEIDRTSGSIINEWNLNQSLDNTRTTLTNDAVDWFHANAVTYDPVDDAIIVSGRTQGMVKLSAQNEVIWIMSPHLDWGTAGNGEDLNQFLLQPIASDNSIITNQEVLDGFENHPDFEWNWYQHAPQILPNGNIILFDNGDNRNYTLDEVYSRAVEYEIDQESMTIKQVWQYGKERGEETYSRIVSDVDYLPTEDHVIVTPGAIGNSSNGTGKSIEVDYATGDVIFEATITPPQTVVIITMHRTERLPLYPN